MTDWIKCEERLPDDRQDIWVSCLLGDGTRYQRTSRYSRNLGFTDAAIPFAVNNVTHWMPLPEKPDED
jgi:hypothetical protein